MKHDIGWRKADEDAVTPDGQSERPEQRRARAAGDAEQGMGIAQSRDGRSH
jgi:hypothetical protein